MTFPSVEGGRLEGSVPDFSDLLNDQIVAEEIQKQRRQPKKPDPLTLLREILAPDTAVTDEQVRSIVKQEIASRVPQVIELKKPGKKAQKIEGQHYLFPLMLKLLTSGLNLALSGPTGSGKTTALVNAAKALDLRFFVQPCSPITSKSDLFGYMDATGKYINTAFRTSYQHGGLYIADEFDCCHPGLAVLLNAAVGNRCVTFPDGETVTAHEDFIFAVCMNTAGLGADQQYVGRNRLDAATLNRFVFLRVDYDEALEMRLAGLAPDVAQICDIEEGGKTDALWVYATAKEYRKAFERHKLPAILSPRDIISAATLARLNIGKAWIKRCVFERGLTVEQVKLVGVVG